MVHRNKTTIFCVYKDFDEEVIWNKSFYLSKTSAIHISPYMFNIGVYTMKKLFPFSFGDTPIIIANYRFSFKVVYIHRLECSMWLCQGWASCLKYLNLYGSMNKSANQDLWWTMDWMSIQCNTTIWMHLGLVIPNCPSCITLVWRLGGMCLPVLCSSLIAHWVFYGSLIE